MSSMFKPPANFKPDLVHTMLLENEVLINIIKEYQNKGRSFECMKYHEILTRNLLYLSGVSEFNADDEFKPPMNQNQNQER